MIYNSEHIEGSKKFYTFSDKEKKKFVIIMKDELDKYPNSNLSKLISKIPDSHINNVDLYVKLPMDENALTLIKHFYKNDDWYHPLIDTKRFSLDGKVVTSVVELATKLRLPFLVKEDDVVDQMLFSFDEDLKYVKHVNTY